MPRTPSDAPAGASASASASAPDPTQAAAPDPTTAASDATPPAQAPNPDPTPATTPVGDPTTPATTPAAAVPAVVAPAAAPVVNINIPATPVLVDEHYAMPFELRKYDNNGDQAEVVKSEVKGMPDKIRRYFLLKGIGSHVKSTEARLQLNAAGQLEALPTDGRPALQLAAKGPDGKTVHTPGCFAVQSQVGR